MTCSKKRRIQRKGDERNGNAAAIVNAHQKQQKQKQKQEKPRTGLFRMLKPLGLAFDGTELLETRRLKSKFRDSLCYRICRYRPQTVEKRLNELMYKIQVHREALRNEPAGRDDDNGPSSIGPGPTRYED
ncbi:hypothetical protein LQW54_011472 [Pestalotiopsis sp. IQ-011]